MTVENKKDMRKNNSKASASELYQFQGLAGKYNFSSCIVRCDTTQAELQIARYMNNPSPQHLEHMLRISLYLSGFPDQGLFYSKNHKYGDSFGACGLHYAVDSSFADGFDNAKSTSGYVIFMAGSPVIWKSKIQSTTSTLTCEAEYAAIFEAVKHCAWFWNFLEELVICLPNPYQF